MMGISGYEKLKADVERDCKQGNDCFNPNGCDHEFYRYVPAEGWVKKYTDTVCKRVSKCMHKYCDKFKWVLDRAKHYSEKTGLNWEDVLDSWENQRDYWYMNYYQEANQPQIINDNVRIFETVDEMMTSIGERKFRCPMCGGISTDPYVCNSGLEIETGKICDWKAYGLFGTLGKGVTVYCKDKLRGEEIFMPVAWEAMSDVFQKQQTP